MAVLQQGLSGGRAVKAVLADALAGKPLSGNEWKLLAFYSWDTDEQQQLAKSALPATLARLAAASPPGDVETSTRLWLKATAASHDGQGVKADPALRERVLRVLADPGLSRQQMDVLTNYAAEIVRTLQPQAGPQRAALVAAFDGSLTRLQHDSSLSRGNRIDALYARVQLVRLDQPKDAVQIKLPDSLAQEIRDHIQRDDREVSDGYERQAVITAAGATLSQAGLWADSEALLKANLAKSHSPYYLMSQLGSNARKLGRVDEALSWYGQAFERSEGPATRLQWGAGYLAALVDLSPQDATRIEKTAAQLLAEAAKDDAAFEGRSVRSLQRVGSKLVAWNADGKQVAAMRRLQAQLDGVCAKVDPAEGQRAACQALLKPAGKKAA
ncbi:MAG TPA: disulfide isomerase [Rubrivivax sp.]|nr:disulfide isomerase [Rubrivivax sp.]